MISIDNVTVAFSGEELFKDISFLINEKDRVGLVGKNGAGKSTLLKIISGIQEPTAGAIGKNGDCTIGYLAQQMPLYDGRTVIEEARQAFAHILDMEKQMEVFTSQLSSRDDYHSAEYEKIMHDLNDVTDRYYMLGGASTDATVERTLMGLGFKRSDFDRPTTEFSGGWRMRIELAKILLSRPSVMLLDEPTNHLDIESIVWLESYIKDYSGAVVLISHDRKFLDSVTTRTVEIMCGKLHDYKVSYSKYVELRAERRAQQQSAYDNQRKMIEQTQDFIDRFRYKPSKSNQVQSRVKQLEKIEMVEIDDEDNSTLNIKFPPAPRSGQIVVEAKDAGKWFDDKHIFSGANLIVEKGDKIAFVGRNGEGKTTFARMIVGDTDVTEGIVRLGHNVIVGYYAQNQDDLMNGDFTVFDTLDRVAVGDIRTRLRDILGAFLFRGDDIDKRVKVLSGGERARLAMARLMLTPCNLLVLDEPTNHMDMRSKDILKQAVAAYDGTVLIISHDREFLDSLATKVYEFRDGVVKEHLGGIYEFLEHRRMEELSDLEAASKPEETKKGSVATESSQNSSASSNTSNNAGSSAASVATGKLSYEQKKEFERIVRKKRNEVQAAEDEIERLDKEIKSMDEAMVSPEVSGIDISDPAVFEKYNTLRANQEKAMREWEHRMAELEIIESN